MWPCVTSCVGVGVIVGGESLVDSDWVCDLCGCDSIVCLCSRLCNV